MGNYTKATFYEIKYMCFDEEKGKYIDEFSMGYFVSMSEAKGYIKEELLDGKQYRTAYGMIYQFDDERPDVPWVHEYSINEIYCGYGKNQHRLTKQMTVD